MSLFFCKMAEKYDYSKPFKVRIIKDCRESIDKKLDGQFGICLGSYEYPHTDKKAPNNASEDDMRYLPLIRVGKEKYIWGTECWWAKEEWSRNEPLGKLQKALKEHVRKFSR